MNFLIQRKNIEIEFLISPTIAVDSDPEIVERIFVNLLTNGIKYTPNNGKIYLSSSETHQGFVRVEVTDTGEGIPSHKLDQVFDRFGQVSSKSSGAIRSTGLGLTFCRLAVEAHGGEIWAESEVDQGTAFIFTLPQAGQAIQHSASDEQLIGKRQPLRLSASDVALLATVVPALKELDAYDTTEVREIVDGIEIDDSQGLQQWKEEMNHALYAMNEAMYAELLALGEE